MARIAGVNIPTSKRVPIALTYITGIGASIANEICDAVKIDKSRRINELSDAEILAMREHIDANFTVEGDLRREVQMNIKRLMDLGCYRGVVIVVISLFVVSALTLMQEPAKVVQKLSLARRNRRTRLWHVKHVV